MVNSSGISFSGLASGLDTASIVTQLLALERIPIQLIEAKKGETQEKLDEIDALATLVETLQEKAEELSTSAGFLSYAVTNPDESVATIAATGAAGAGTHTLEVLSVAATDRWAFDAVADADTDLGSGSGEQVTFTVNGNAYAVDIDAASSSLNEIAAAIESEAGDDVSATVVNEGTEANPSYRLVLASKETGEDARFTALASTVPGLTITYSAPDANDDPTSANNLTVGVNAEAIVDGLTVERADNDFSDVIEGVDLTVLSTNVGSTLTFSIDPDKDAIRAGLQDFVDSYNDVVRFINRNSTYTPGEDEDDAGTTAPLFGDSLLRTVHASMRRALFDVDTATVQADTEGYSTLSLVGIDIEDNGTLAIDEDQLDEKMLANLELFSGLFTDDDGFDNGGADPNTPEYYTDTTADSGLFASLGRELDRLFGSSEGPIDPGTGERITLDAAFDLRRDTLREDIDRFDDRIDAMERRLEGYERNLNLRFARLEELMGALNAQGAALANALFPTASSS